VRIGPGDVGRRVSVHSRLPTPPGDPGPLLTDTVGLLEGWEGGTLRIRRRDGTVATLATADLVAGRVVPDPPARRGH
jgi:N-acetylglutamate synthase